MCWDMVTSKPAQTSPNNYNRGQLRTSDSIHTLNSETSRSSKAEALDLPAELTSISHGPISSTDCRHRHKCKKINMLSFWVTEDDLFMPCLKHIKSQDRFMSGTAPRGGQGAGRQGQLPPYDFFFWGGCLSAQRSVMSMMIIPLPHYDNFGGNFWSRGEKKVLRLSRLAVAVVRHFALPKQTPWHRPWFMYHSEIKTPCTPRYKLLIIKTTNQKDTNFPGGGGYSPLNWVGGCQWGGGVKIWPCLKPLGTQKIHLVTKYLTKSFHICIPCCNIAHLGYIYPVLLLFYSKKKWKTRNLLRPARTIAGAEIAGLS